MTIVSHCKMLNQRLSRTLQALARQHQRSNCIRQSSSSASPFTSRNFAPPGSQRIGNRRRYSQAHEAEAKKEESSEEQTEELKGRQEAEAGATDGVQKELETKKREVIDVTVCL